MLTRTDGIVLRTIPFGEADLIVTYLTSDYGLVKTFAKSPRKIKSRFGSSLEPLTHARISFWGKEDAALPRLTQSDIIDTFHHLRDNIHRFLRVSEIVELTLQFLPERDANKRVYSLLLETLKAVERQQEIPAGHAGVSRTTQSLPIVSDNGKGVLTESMILDQYKVRFLELAGFAPKLDACGRCGRSGYSFFLSHGAILCEECIRTLEAMTPGNGSAIRLSPAVARFYKDLLTWEVTKISRLKPSDTLYAELSRVLNAHIQFILAKPLKTRTFPQTIKMD
ncbi:MAG TPA: DNA repair protein RecO [Thermodesulfovibrionales bacterium]|nr:DNA repair protein RecO [Thermodesulfovibrionales bacterium]